MTIPLGISPNTLERGLRIVAVETIPKAWPAPLVNAISIKKAWRELRVSRNPVRNATAFEAAKRIGRGPRARSTDTIAGIPD